MLAGGRAAGPPILQPGLGAVEPSQRMRHALQGPAVPLGQGLPAVCGVLQEVTPHHHHAAWWFTLGCAYFALEGYEGAARALQTCVWDWSQIGVEQPLHGLHPPETEDQGVPQPAGCSEV